MGSIAGISTVRVSDLMMRQQLVSQIEAAQTQMLQSQEQMSTGKSFQLPGQNPTAALQGTDLQRLLAQNTQMQANIQSAQSYLGATDSAMTSIANLLSSIRATALGAVGTTETTAQQQAAAAQIGAGLQQLVTLGNQQFNGRYLFGGSATNSPPFTITQSGSVQYTGNNVQLQSYFDIGRLMTTNVTGEAAFGALTPAVGETTDFNPVLTADTPLSTLNGGKGVAAGSIMISDGTNVSTIDLSGASTIGQVANLIESHPPAGDTINVSVTSTGLQLQLAGGGQMSVTEVANGTTAAGLGIATPPPGSNTIVGQDLNPAVTLETKLSDLQSGVNLAADAAVQIVNGGKTYTVSLAGAKTINDVLNDLNTAGAGVVAQINSAGSGISVQSQISGSDFEIGEASGGDAATQLGIRTFTTSTPLSDLNYGSGVGTVSTSGPDFTIKQADGNVVSVGVSGDNTVQDVLNSINNSSSQEIPPTLTASLAPDGNGIQLVDTSLATGSSGLTVSIVGSSQVAVNLGLVPVGQSSNSAPTATPQTLTGTDPNPLEAPGILNAVARLQQAVTTNDQAGIQRGLTLLDSSTAQFSLAEAENGAQEQNLAAMLTQQQTQNTSLQQNLSNAVNVDFATAASNYSADQVAYQAALQTTATVSQMSLFNYL
jgi:flagellin-like hook-associated protein FlgL